MKWFSALTQQVAAGLQELEIKNDKNQELKRWWEGYCDGSYYTHALALGIGGHLNNPEGEQVADFSDAAQVETDLPNGSAYAEYEAAFRMLRLAGQKGIKRLIVKMDNRSAVLTLSHQKKANAEMAELAKKVLAETSGFEEVVFQWVPRIKNKVADELSRAKIQSLGLLEVEGQEKKAPSIKPRTMVDEELPERLGVRHPGVFHVDRSKALAKGAGEKARADAQWNGTLYIRTHAVLGPTGDGVAAGAEVYGGSKPPRGAFYSELKESPSLCEVKLILRLLNKAKSEGHKRVLIETTSQTLSLVCSGLREPSTHIKSAIYTLFNKAAYFEKIAIRHRAPVPPWADQLEGVAKEQLGFHYLPNGFDNTLKAEMLVSTMPIEGVRSLVIGLNIAQTDMAIQIRRLPLLESDAASEARWIAQSIKRLADVGISRVNIRSQTNVQLDVQSEDAQEKSAWAQLRIACERANCTFEQLETPEIHELHEEAMRFIQKRDQKLADRKAHRVKI